MSWGFIVGMTVLTAVAFFGVFDQMLPVFQGQMPDELPAGYSIQLAISFLQTDVVFLVLPILSALPFTAAFVGDCKSRYLQELYICQYRADIINNLSRTVERRIA